MRNVQNFNADWRFIPEKVAIDAPEEFFESITLPHTNKLFPRHSVDNHDYQFIATYRKRFTLSDQIAAKRLFIDFDGVMLASFVYLNGQLLGNHKGGYTPFSFEITDYAVVGENVLTVYVDATENPEIPPFGGKVDYLAFGGIYRDVYLRVVEPCHVVNVFARPINVLTAPALECDVQIAELASGLVLDTVLQDSQGHVLARTRQDVHAEYLTAALSDLPPVELWTLENPALYVVSIRLYINDNLVDEVSTRVGFRAAEFSTDGSFYLNGQPLKLFGLNRHQTYPYIGAAAPARLQQLDAEILKYELGCNIVRTSHYAQSPHFINHCDEIGLLVLEEIAGWQHIGDAAWQALVLQDLEAMIKRDRNHPSIILWGVRVNESPDDDELYLCTNQIAHELDSTRQTGGIRNFIYSHFLEDVFTLNDFSEDIQTPLVRPHLITEFGGHMFPTKTWDNEERRLEHAFKHVHKHNLQMGHPDVAGAIGWCAFDYHTHQDFGSGDRICYHGVMDMDRLPKLAAYFYRSQKSPKDEVVLNAATSWTMGDRSGGGNNPLTIFSNCDEVEIVIGDHSYTRIKPDTEQFPHLPHPPFIIGWSDSYNPWGTGLDDLTVRGFIKGEMVAEQKIAADHVPHALRLKASSATLYADGADMARVTVQIVDKYGNVLPYQARIARFEVAGPAELIGENPLVLMGGQGAVYLKSRHTTGDVTLRAVVDDLPSAEVIISVGEKQP